MHIIYLPFVVIECCCRICFCKYSVHLKDRPQIPHGKGLSSECVDKWRLSLCLFGHMRPQLLHLYRTNVCLAAAKSGIGAILISEVFTMPSSSNSFVVIVGGMIFCESSFSFDFWETSLESLLSTASSWRRTVWIAIFGRVSPSESKLHNKYAST